MKKSKTQTAMEYLMTYGWAILIVLVVVAALYSMGAFCMGENCAKTTMTQSDCYNGCFLIGYTESSKISSDLCKCCFKVPVRGMGNVTYCETIRRISNLEWQRE